MTNEYKKFFYGWKIIPFQKHGFYGLFDFDICKFLFVYEAKSVHLLNFPFLVRKNYSLIT